METTEFISWFFYFISEVILAIPQLFQLVAQQVSIVIANYQAQRSTIF